jgi:chloride channel protein, CIC family
VGHLKNSQNFEPANGLDRFRSVVRAFFQRHWQRALRIRERLRFSEETFHLVLAGGVGVIGGLVNVVFYLGFEFFKILALGQRGDLLEVAEVMNAWQRLLTPTLGGLVAGAVLFWGLRMVGSQGATHLLEVVVAGNGRLPFRTAVVKSISSLISMSTGASIGREGAIIQLTATLASKWGQLADWPPYRLRLLVACGAASGIAAAYNAPVAGAVFAAQIVLGNFAMNLFAPLVFASVVATMVSRSFFGIRSWYNLPPFDFTHVTQLPWFVLLGIISGALGAAFLKTLRESEKLFDRAAFPIYARLMLGGLIVGVISLGFPEVWGNGYAATNWILHDRYALSLLAGLFFAKLLATLASVGSSAVGGVFTPTLFLGATLGSGFGGLLHSTELAGELPASTFALAGMGSLLAATTHSPLLAMIMIFEISLNYSLMPPLMIACVVSTIVARRFHKESIYTEPLRLETLAAERESMQVGAAMQKTVGDLMGAAVSPIRETATFREIADRFLSSPNNFLPVVDGTGQLIGLVALQDLKQYLNRGEELSAVIAYDVMRPPPLTLTPNQPLVTALPVLLASEQRNIPVVNNQKNQRLIGSLPRAEVLGLFSEAIAVGTTPKA